MKELSHLKSSENFKRKFQDEFFQAQGEVISTNSNPRLIVYNIRVQGGETLHIVELKSLDPIITCSSHFV